MTKLIKPTLALTLSLMSLLANADEIDVLTKCHDALLSLPSPWGVDKLGTNGNALIPASGDGSYQAYPYSGDTSVHLIPGSGFDGSYLVVSGDQAVIFRTPFAPSKDSRFFLKLTAASKINKVIQIQATDKGVRMQPSGEILPLNMVNPKLVVSSGDSELALAPETSKVILRDFISKRLNDSFSYSAGAAHATGLSTRSILDTLTQCRPAASASLEIKVALCARVRELGGQCDSRN